MILEAIEAQQFRNLSGTIQWGRGLNIIYGDNGQGKTNWLEAIYLLSRTKSFRTQRLQESIRFGHDSAFVRGTVSFGRDSISQGSALIPNLQSSELTPDLQGAELSQDLAGAASTQRLQGFDSTRGFQEVDFTRDPEKDSLSRNQPASELTRDLQVTLQGGNKTVCTKTISVNGKKETLARYLGQLQVFAFTADELEVVRGTPEARRRFIDRGGCSLQPAFVQTLSDYNRVLKQKNRILQDSSELELSLAETEDLLQPWNEQLVKLGTQIHTSRTDYINQLNEAFEHGLFEREGIQIRYVSSLDGKGDLSNYEPLLSERLKLRLEAEVAAGRALIGPHRDDLEILSDGREMRVFGSSGQQRSALLLLDLAAISVYNSRHDDYPIFLIDDVDAELDEKRINKLLEYLEGRTQTFLTTSKRSHLQGFLSRASLYEIEDGKVANNASGQKSFSKALA